MLVINIIIDFLLMLGIPVTIQCIYDNRYWGIQCLLFILGLFMFILNLSISFVNTFAYNYCQDKLKIKFKQFKKYYKINPNRYEFNIISVRLLKTEGHCSYTDDIMLYFNKRDTIKYWIWTLERLSISNKYKKNDIIKKYMSIINTNEK